MSELLLVNAHVVDPSQQLDEIRPVAIKDGVFADVSDLQNPMVLNLTGKTVAPGFIDMHVHVREPGQTHKEDMETATAAAAAGGFTTILAMPNTLPPVDTPERLDMVRKLVREKACVNVIQSCCITQNREGNVLSDIPALKQAGCVALTDDGSTPQDENVMRTVMKLAAEVDLPVIDHCENVSLSKPGVMHQGSVSALLGVPGQPREAELSIVERDLRLAAETGCHIHLQHISCKESMDMLREARAKGVKATAEITPHHLLLTHHDCLKYGTLAKMAPPLREEADRQALVEAILDGTVDVIATDHAPHAMEEKSQGWAKSPFGITGIENAVSLCYTLLVKECGMDLSRFVQCFTTGPNNILKTDRATMKTGHPADVTILDVNAEITVQADKLHSKSLNCPWIGRHLFATVCGILKA